MGLWFSSSTIRAMGVLGLVMVAMMMGELVRSDITQDKNECADQLLGLATCIGYVGGKAKAPTSDCCSGMKQVVQKSKKCMCILVKDRDDPSLGLQINATLALGLPALCGAPTNITECIALLNLTPNSPEAKVFEDYVHANGNGTATATAPLSPKGGKGNSTATSSISRNSGERRKSWVAADVAILSIIFIIFVF